ncbi:NAD(P)/FAD-dependent oxidoreductase [Teredinibacter sp. KSP-S5-2]|uniref:NAD(P)/FAD-dependent oxidoreductase n=1 Tax=Teredinibacter sp. KSP-S5-2 TaxID=3034506 RepID=UPI002934283C|nr:tryptophan 7-halogenase [Teredinibacter sp. KSP-S5-2]WNO09950.1 tryptophan 7-halogenase [Teredinibacter sp. KSP-S5-2]
MGITQVNTPEKHIVIIGKGPAACATALSLLREQKNPNDYRISLVSSPESGKPAIGETLPPAATPLMRELGVDQLLETNKHILCPGSISRWGSDETGHNDFSFTPIGPGYHLDREKFDQSLLRHLRQQKVSHIPASLKKVTPCENGFLLGLQSYHGAIELQADFVVDATGIRAAFARRIGVRHNVFDSVISLCAFFQLEQPTEQPAYTLVSTVAEGWWYATQLPGQKVLVSLCSDSSTIRTEKLDSPQHWFDALNKATWFCQQCEQQFGQRLTPPKQIHSRVAPSSILSNVVGQQWLAVGDAASSYDSMTSAGISKALSNGLAAGKAIAEYYQSHSQYPLKRYQQQIFDDFNHYLQLHQQHYQSEQRFPESHFWRTRQLQGLQSEQNTYSKETYA